MSPVRLGANRRGGDPDGYEALPLLDHVDQGAAPVLAGAEGARRGGGRLRGREGPGETVEADRVRGLDRAEAVSRDPARGWHRDPAPVQGAGRNDPLRAAPGTGRPRRRHGLPGAAARGLTDLLHSFLRVGAIIPPEMARVLVVDDEPALRRALERAL